MYIRSTIFILLLFIFFPTCTNAQKVGLVLSGGGAKGLAHIGVIRVLEENGIPIDYVTGTSMGAIIGGLYSIGYSPEEMEEIVTSERFLKWANGEIEEEYMYFFKKDEIQPTLFDFKIEVEDSVPKAILPSSLVPTHQMDIQLMNFYAGAAAAAGYDFNKLFVPFRCVATDITNNREVIFRSGSLAKAIRASMTFPFYYKPIREDSIVYFDGGMKNNFPSDVMKKDFQPDYIIGSKTAKNAPVPETDDALAQLQNMLLGETDYDLDDSTGTLIDVNLDSVDLFDFAIADKIIQKGYRAAQSKIGPILEHIPRRIDSTELALRRDEFRKKTPELSFYQIDVKGISTNRKTYVKRYIQQDNPHITLQEFKRSYFKLLADDNISSIYPIARYDSTRNSFHLTLDIDQENHFSAGIGGNISSSTINQGFGRIQFNHLGTNAKQISANVYYGRLYSSAKIAGRIDFPSKPEMYFKTAFILNRWDYFNSSNEPFFEDVRPSYLIKNESFLTSEVGIPVGYNGRFSLGLNIGNIRPEYYLKDKFLKSDTLDITKFKYVYPFVKYESNTLNFRQYPTEGRYFRLKAYFLMGDEQFIPGSNGLIDERSSHSHRWFNVNLQYKNFLHFTKPFILGYSLELNYTNRDFFTNYSSTLLTSEHFTPIPHSKTLFLKNFISHDYLGLTLSPILRFTRKLHLHTTFSGFLPYQPIQERELWRAGYGDVLSEFYTMSSASLVYHTVLGPASLSLNYYNKENKKFYFLFNFGFILSNENALN